MIADGWSGIHTGTTKPDVAKAVAKLLTSPAAAVVIVKMAWNRVDASALVCGRSYLHQAECRDDVPFIPQVIERQTG